MCDRVIFEDLFMLIYCPNRYKTQKMCDKAADDCLAAIKFIPDWFVSSKMLEKVHDALLTNDDIRFLGEGFSEVRFFAIMKWVLLV